MENFEQTLENNPSLNKLITNEEISMMTKFKKTGEFSSEFIDWLSPKYYEAFVSIFETVVGSEKEVKMIALLNAPKYCNEVTKEKILDFIVPYIKSKSELATSTLNSFNAPGLDFIQKMQYANVIKKELLSYVNIVLFKHFDSPKIEEDKTNIINCSLKITDSYKSVKASNEFEFKIFTDLLVRFEKLKLNDKQRAVFNTFKTKEKSSINKNFIWGGVVIVLIILRMVMRMSR